VSVKIRAHCYISHGHGIGSIDGWFVFQQPGPRLHTSGRSWGADAQDAGKSAPARKRAFSTLVGTDIVHAVALTGVTSLLHWRLGNVDFRLVGFLLIGSIPGGLLGSYLSTRVPVLWLRRILCAVLLATGARMLWA